MADVLVKADPVAVQAGSEFSVSAVAKQMELIHDLMRRVMIPGADYGVIPGTKKPTLLKPGAEKLVVLFRLRPTFSIQRNELENGHREYEVTCLLEHIESGRLWGEGVGECTTMESRYRYRSTKRSCPECQKETIIKGKQEFGGGWLCWKNKGGCGAKFDDSAPEIMEQVVGKQENPDIADVYNTVKKIAKKRALVDAVLTCTASSALFTQDVEDMAPPTEEHAPRPNGGSEGPKFANENQLRLVRSRMTAKAKAAGRERKEVADYLLEALGIKSSKELLARDVDRALELIEQIHSIQKTEAVPISEEEAKEIAAAERAENTPKPAPAAKPVPAPNPTQNPASAPVDPDEEMPVDLFDE